MALRVRTMLALGLAAVLIAACGGSDNPAPSSTPSPSPSPTATTTPAPSPSPGGPMVVPSTVQLVDAASGGVTVLYEDTAKRAFHALFAGDRAWVLAEAGDLFFDLEGRPVSGTRPGPLCREVDGAAEIGGQSFPGVSCGNISPDGRWMLYQVDAGTYAHPNGYEVPVWDQWALDIETGSTRLVQDELIHCGGCDGIFGPRWSPSGRYVVYPEFGGERRRFLTDLATGETRVIGHGAGVHEAPAWAATRDLLVYGSLTGEPTMLEDLAAGRAREIDLAWPVAFDATGSVMYSPAWATDPKRPGQQTTIAEVATGATLHVLPGTPPDTFAWIPGTAVMVSEHGLLAALQHADGCDGTVLYVEGVLDQCIAGGQEAQLGLGGQFAVAVKTGTVGPAVGPGFETIEIDEFEVVLVEPGGKPRAVITGVASFAAPLMAWHPEGGYLLVLWPRAVGL